MKYWILIFAAIPGVSQAVPRDLFWFDQEKLAALVETLPVNLRTREEEVITRPRDGIVVESTFPYASNRPFKIHCQSYYYNQSRFASTAKCSLDVDLNHPDVLKKYNEFKVTIDGDEAKALYAAIPYGRPRKEFHSVRKQEGVLYTGKKGNVFDYYFNCFPDECILRVSTLAPEED